MAKEFKDLTIKGDTYARHLQSEQGRGLLRWLIKQDIKDDKFAEWTLKRNQWIKEQLEMHKDDVAENREMLPDIPPQNGTGTPQSTPESTNPQINVVGVYDLLSSVNGKIDIILGKLTRMESKEQVEEIAWDE